MFFHLKIMRILTIDRIIFVFSDIEQQPRRRREILITPSKRSATRGGKHPSPPALRQECYKTCYLCCTPIGVLKKLSISFHPELRCSYSGLSMLHTYICAKWQFCIFAKISNFQLPAK